MIKIYWISSAIGVIILSVLILERYLDKPEHKDLTERLYNELNHQVITANVDLKSFKDELTDIWFTPIKSKKSKSSDEISTGFRYVFCGELMKKTLGGMHFVGRYLQA